MGQVLLLVSQRSMQAVWKLWQHGNAVAAAPMGHMQMVQSAWAAEAMVTG